MSKHSVSVHELVHEPMAKRMHGRQILIAFVRNPGPVQEVRGAPVVDAVQFEATLGATTSSKALRRSFDPGTPTLDDRADDSLRDADMLALRDGCVDETTPSKMSAEVRGRRRSCYDELVTVATCLEFSMTFLSGEVDDDAPLRKEPQGDGDEWARWGSNPRPAD